jgi:hypothetical protein
MTEINVQDVLDYIEERCMADGDTTWEKIKIRFGEDPAFVIGNKLVRPGNIKSIK